MHLAEYRAPGFEEIVLGAPLFENGQRVWKSYRDIEIDSDIFPEIGADFERAGQVCMAKVSSVDIRLSRQKAAVDFAQEWLTARRTEKPEKPA